jgi:uncharacterized membrane protein YdjX (TVP38/TMEM64 family)
MRYFFRFLLMMVLLTAIAVVAYSYVGDLTAQRTPTETPVTLEVN